MFVVNYDVTSSPTESFQRSIFEWTQLPINYICVELWHYWYPTWHKKNALCFKDDIQRHPWERTEVWHAARV